MHGKHALRLAVGAAANTVFTAAERWAGHVTDHFVVVADAMRRQYLAAGIGRHDQYTRIFSGFDLGPFQRATRDPALARALGIQESDLVVGKIARLFERKGHDDLFDAAPAILQRLPRVRFLLVGDGAWRARLEARARDSGFADRFVFAGLVPPGEVCRYVGLMDLLVHLSTREGLARALPQALANAKPVIAYNCDGAGEVCRTDETGILVPAGDQPSLIDAVARLAGDAALRRRLGCAGQAWVADRFTIDRLVRDQESLYYRVLAAPPARR